MNLLSHFNTYIKNENLFQKNDTLLLAVSGGVDSIVLCELCKQAGYNFVIAHCNFQLRGEESSRDEQFVRQLAIRYAVPVLIKLFDTLVYATSNKLSLQVSARTLRYNWFNDILDGKHEDIIKPKYLLTAHHADDNIETMLMNFFKGTGISGLRAILPKQGRTVRPVLFAHKSALLKFAGDNNLQFVEDSSNQSDKYTRNYFRNELLPAIEKVFPEVENNLSKNLLRFRETEQLYLQSVHRHKLNLLDKKGNEVHIPVLKLKKSMPLSSIVYEITKDYGFNANQTNEIINLLDSETGKYIQSADYRIIKNRNWLIIAPRETGKAQNIIINKDEVKLVFEAGTIKCGELSLETYQESASPEMAQLDADKIMFPLLLRKRKQGDYFYPLGMQKKKKLSRFLGDLKLSVTAKEHTWVIEMNKKIIWVTGRRIDDRFKITGSTKKVLQLTFIPRVY